MHAPDGRRSTAWLLIALVCSSSACGDDDATSGATSTSSGPTSSGGGAPGSTSTTGGGGDVASGGAPGAGGRGGEGGDDGGGGHGGDGQGGDGQGGDGRGGDGQGGDGQGGSGQGGGSAPQLDPTWGDAGIALVDTGAAAGALTAAARQATGRVILLGTPDGAEESPLLLVALDDSGALDASFGSVGAVLAPLLAGVLPTDVVVQPDDRIVVVGAARRALGEHVAFVARFAPDGGLDPTFGGGDGVVLGDDGGAGAVALQPDGKIVVAASRDGVAAVVRYMPDGSLDASFGAGGISPPSAALGGTPRGIVVTDDGHIAVLFQASNGAVARLTAGGAFDPAFGDGGVAAVPFRPYVLAAASDGALHVGGVTPGGPAELVRFLPDGDLDVGFGTDGHADLGGVDWVADAIVEADGSVVVAGDLALSSRGMLARVTPDGDLDPAFGGGDGVAEDVLGTSATARGLVAREDGTYVAAGVQHAAPTSIVSAAVLEDGASDPSFGDAGVARHEVSARTDELTRMVLAPDGSVTLVGRAPDDALARLDASGQLDPGFGDGGVTRTPVAHPDAVAHEGGRVLAATRGALSMEVRAYDATGALDASFGEAGAGVLVDGVQSGAEAVAVDATGRVLAAGHQRVDARDRLVVGRLTAAGEIDLSFAGDGVAGAPEGIDAGSGVAVAALADGGALVATAPFRYGLPEGPSLVLRFDEDGAIDETFGDGGVVPLDLDTVPRRIVELADGAVLVAGRRRACASTCVHHALVTRILSTGDLDPSFGTGGTFSMESTSLVPWPFDARFDTYALPDLALVVDGAGRILIGDAARIGDRDRMLLVRLAPDGQLDPTFGDGGRMLFPDRPGSWRIVDAALQPDGRLLVGGVGFSPTTGYDLAVLRLQE